MFVATGNRRLEGAQGNPVATGVEERRTNSSDQAQCRTVTHPGYSTPARNHFNFFKQRARRPARRLPGRQRGMSLVEVMVGLTLSMMVSGTAITVMGNTLGSGSQVIQSLHLSQDLRRSLQIMTRDVRRAGYTAGAMWCIGNTVCLPDATVNLPVDASLPLTGSFVMPSGITIDPANDCFSFELDRNHDGTVTAGEHGAYRRVSRFGVGVLEMWLGAGAPDCDSISGEWVAMTDLQVVDVTWFNVDDDLSYSEVVSVDLLGNTTSQRVRRIRLQVEGRLLAASSFTERIEDIIDVRNDELL